MATASSAAWSRGCSRCCAAPTPTEPPISAARSPAGSARWLPRHRSARPTCAPRSPTRTRPGSRPALRDAWDNLGRVAGEYVHMARIADFDPDHPNAGRIRTDDVPMFEMLRTTASPPCVRRASGELGDTGHRRRRARPALRRGLPHAEQQGRREGDQPHPRAADGPPDPHPRPGRGGDGGGAAAPANTWACWSTSISPAASMSRSLGGAARAIPRSPGWRGGSTARSSACG